MNLDPRSSESPPTHRRGWASLAFAFVLAGVIAIALVSLWRPGGVGQPGAAPDIVTGLSGRQSQPHSRPRAETQLPPPTEFADSGSGGESAALDPLATGWESEALSETAKKVIDELILPASDRGRWPLAEDFRSTALTPTRAATIFHSENFTIRRAEPDSPEFPYAGADGLAEALAQLQIGATARTKVKVVGFERSAEGGFSTRMRIETVSGNQQSIAGWACRWKDGEPIRLREIALTSHETAIAKGEPLFEDVTVAAIGESATYGDLVLRGINHWAARLTKIDGMNFYGHQGLAIGDANGDGLDDLYVCDSGGLPNQLYLQNPDGTAREAAGQAGVDWLEDSRSALFVDLDNDGDQDLVVATIALVVLLENLGEARFQLRRGILGNADPHSLAAADYDNDGDLDLYICNYSQGVASGRRGFESKAPAPYDDAVNGGRNTLFENIGDFRFVDVTDGSGLDVENTRWSFAAAWEDYDLDGDQDLYVVNDFGRNCLYRNDGDHFDEIASEAGTRDVGAGMAVAWGDPNRDGRPDIHVGNMFSAAGNRVAFQPRFTDAHAGGAASIQRMARGNTLFLARDDGGFEDASQFARITMARWAWSSGFADLNNDGWEDLAVANGFFTNTRADDL